MTNVGYYIKTEQKLISEEDYLMWGNFYRKSYIINENEEFEKYIPTGIYHKLKKDYSVVTFKHNERFDGKLNTNL